MHHQENIRNKPQKTSSLKKKNETVQKPEQNNKYANSVILDQAQRTKHTAVSTVLQTDSMKRCPQTELIHIIYYVIMKSQYHVIYKAKILTEMVFSKTEIWKLASSSEIQFLPALLCSSP